MPRHQITISPEYDSVFLTKGKGYPVIEDHGDSIFVIKNDAGDIITVCAASSAWTYGQAWKITR